YQINHQLLNLSVLNAIDRLAFLLQLEVNSAYFVQFKSFVWEKFKKEGVSVSDYIRYWKTLEEKDSIPSLKNSQSDSAIQVLTIHKSKGLQYPVVILPYINWEVDFRSTIKWIQPEGIHDLKSLAVTITPKTLSNTSYKNISLAETEEAFLESTNTLYVALTRAEEQLYALADVKKGIGKFIYENVRQNPILSTTKIELGNNNRSSVVKNEKSKNLIELKKSIKEKSTELNIAPESDQYWKESKTTELDYGTFFHEVMKKIMTLKDKEKVFYSIKSDANLSEEN
ncbi:MAG: 3'-5' exonuclease, partial [Bacteroidia bacterium]